jgi:hypothetical protein
MRHATPPTPSVSYRCWVSLVPAISGHLPPTPSGGLTTVIVPARRGVILSFIGLDLIGGDTMAYESDSVGLAEAVRQPRAELTEAMAEGEGKDVQFELGPVEMEFLVDVRREGGAEAGVG